MKFTKMHGCGNDYVYVNCLEENVENPVLTARIVSDRHFGIGSDGLILIKPSVQADFCMEMYNADGSEGKMCGNGVRCIAKYVYDTGMTEKTSISLETKAGLKYLDLEVKEGKVQSVRVDMGEPVTEPARIPAVWDQEIILDQPVTVGDQEYRITCVSMGNPHAVVFVADTSQLPIEQTGPLFEHHEMFPEGINTEFVQVIDRHTINMRVWERGSGETLACGTGATASVYACILNGLTEDEVLVHLLGGDLKIQYDREKNTMLMTGPAVRVFDGEIDVDSLGQMGEVL